MVRTIHYDLSYLVSDAERGPKGAFVLLHDLPGGAFVWQNVMPTLAATGRAVYALICSAMAIRIIRGQRTRPSGATPTRWHPHWRSWA